MDCWPDVAREVKLLRDDAELVVLEEQTRATSDLAAELIRLARQAIEGVVDEQAFWDVAHEVGGLL